MSLFHHTCRYGRSAAASEGPPDGGETLPWLRKHAVIGRVELYLITHDPLERVDLSAVYTHIVASLLSQMQALLRETAREGPDVTGWLQRAPGCPRFIRELNITERCCQPLVASLD